MKNVNPGARFGIAFAIEGDVRFIPFNIKDLNIVTLKKKHTLKSNKSENLNRIITEKFD